MTTTGGASTHAPHARAVGRSLRTYHAPGRAALLDGFLARFVVPGRPAFDVGAHVGDRAASFLRLGASPVVAVEPQPRLARLLRRMEARHPALRVVEAVVGAVPGRATLRLNSANPTVATASPAFVEAARGAPGWEGQAWDGAAEVPATTLDALCDAHGAPAFLKLDVEGHEAEALAGLSRPVAALSFEVTTIARGVALAALDRLAALSPGYRFNAALGESHALALPGPVGAGDMRAWLAALPAAANSGDVYAVLGPAAGAALSP